MIKLLLTIIGIAAVVLSLRYVRTSETEPHITVLPSALGDPISNAGSRITKKSFGTYVSPKNSPVSPERFTGYHTGVDFEASANEQDTDIPVSAICDGDIVLSKTASGYGGVVVQQCSLDNQPITVIYGHLKPTSLKPLSTHLSRGQQLGILGKGYSAETDGERKHLHLGIHQGATINILGYVQTQSLLSQWLNWEDKN
ncbi:M23 family metallopeptidase [Candidatus Parcubacteria bacterium]|nr:M23 family metallopeptidase [Candidatus Parcubacteria bacterium]